MPFVTRSVGAKTVDRGIALLAGRDAWAHADHPTSAVTRMAAFIEIGGFIIATSALWTYRFTLTHHYESTIIRLAPFGFAAAAALLTIAPQRVARGRLTTTRAGQLFVLPRALLGVTLVTTAYSIIPGWASLISWPVGIALGADAALTSWALGWHFKPLRWWGLFVISPIHFGVVGGLLGALVYQGWDAAERAALPIYITMHVWVLIASITAWWLGVLHDQEKRDRRRAVDEAASLERRRSAHWLHDDLCAQLRLVSITVQSGGATMADVEVMLDDLDHQIRLRQVEEIFDSGTIRIAEVLQPYVRRAQNRGVHIDSAPSFDDASLTVSADVGRQFSHAAAVLTSNAINAGATHIAFEVHASDEFVTITVTDDAGGIKFADLPSGRSLWVLREDLGADNVTVSSTSNGSRVQATINLTHRTRDDAVAAR